MEWYHILIFVLCVLMAAALLVLWKRGYLSQKDVADMGSLLDKSQEFIGGLEWQQGSVMDFLLKCVSFAWHAAEQLMYNGSITPDQRMTKAMVVMDAMAETAGIELSTKDKITAEYLLEAECNRAGHSNYIEKDMNMWTLAEVLAFAHDNGFNVPESLPQDEGDAKQLVIDCMFGALAEEYGNLGKFEVEKEQTTVTVETDARAEAADVQTQNGKTEMSEGCGEQ